MFRRVLAFALELGRELAESPEELAWADDLDRKVQGFVTYSPDVDVEDLFSSPDQCTFWSRVLQELATRIYERRIGSQDDQTWQVPTIWASADLARVLTVADRRWRRDAGAA